MYENYAKLRDSKGYTDYKVAKGTGVSAATLSEWKKGKYTPKTAKLQKIADFLEVSLEYLTTGKDTEKESESGTKYYFNDETAELAQALYEDPNQRVLFNASRNAKPEDLQMAADLLNRLKETNPNG